MNSLPKPILKELLSYSSVLFLLSCYRTSQKEDNYWQAIIGSLIGTITLNSKNKLRIALLGHIAFMAYPECYFYVYGYTISQAYLTKVLLSRTTELKAILSKVEMIGWVCSEIIVIPDIFKFILSFSIFIISFYINPISIEAEDPFDEMKKKIDKPSLLNEEYRRYVKKEKEGIFNDVYPFVYELLFVISDRKLLVLFFSFFSIEFTELAILPIGLCIIFGITWEPFAFLLKGFPRGHPVLRVLSTYILSSIIRFILGNLRKE